MDWLSRPLLLSILTLTFDGRLTTDNRQRATRIEYFQLLFLFLERVPCSIFRVLESAETLSNIQHSTRPRSWMVKMKDEEKVLCKNKKFNVFFCKMLTVNYVYFVFWHLHNIKFYSSIKSPDLAVQLSSVHVSCSIFMLRYHFMLRINIRYKVHTVYCMHEGVSQASTIVLCIGSSNIFISLYVV